MNMIYREVRDGAQLNGVGRIVSSDGQAVAARYSLQRYRRVAHFQALGTDSPEEIDVGVGRWAGTVISHGIDVAWNWLQGGATELWLFVDGDTQRIRVNCSNLDAPGNSIEFKIAGDMVNAAA